MFPPRSDAAAFPALGELSRPGQTSLARLAPGYLFLEGLFRQIDLLANAGEARVLIGNLTHHETLEQIAQRSHRLEPMHDAAEARRYVSRPQARQIVGAAASGFRKCLERMEQTAANQAAGSRALAMLDAKQLLVRLHVNGSFGTRIYLFAGGDGGEGPAVGYAGSSNVLLPAGLDPTDYLVAVRDQESLARLARHFDGLWGQAADVSAVLAEEIRNSWVGLLASPYDVYMKTLYTLVRERVEFDPQDVLADEDVIARLADFQRSAFRQAVQIIRDFGGAFVSDVVGLGKSYIGAAVVKHFEQTEHVRPLIVCPAPLVEMWERYSEALRLNAQVVSFGLLRRAEGGDNVLLDDFRYKDRDFVLIDESHTFRNPGSQRYEVLRDFMARGRRRACLLTATPRSRSGWDIYHQIKLFHQEDRTTLPIDPPNLRDFFRAVERGERELPVLLSNLLIRRTRNHILRFYGHDAETGRRVDPSRFTPYLEGRRRAYVTVGGERQFFPRRELTTVEYSIERTYQGLYGRIRDYLTPPTPAAHGEPPPARLLFARYGLWNYVGGPHRNVEPYAQLRTAAGLHGLVRVLLFKRFESSVEAFRCSVGRMIDAHRLFLAAIREGIVPAGDEAQALLREVGESEEEDVLDALRDSSRRYAIEHFEEERLIHDIEHDLRLLEELFALVEPITPERDEKLQVLCERLGNPPLSSGKRLIFTQFTDTARYLYERLREEGRPGQCVALMLASERNKGAVIGRFAPRANREQAPADPGQEIATLITTDVMSEGLNLQDCDKIVNYDLHWNPVRLIQRFGRIDRIGSEHERIHGFNFLPEAGLEQNLGLRQILRRRIREIHETIGEDSSILEADERLNEQAMYAIYESTGEGLARLEEEPNAEAVYLAEAEELLRLLREADPAEYERIASLPDGIRSARRSGEGGLFVFSRAGLFRELQLVDQAGRVVSNDIPGLLGLLKCGKETPAVEFPERLVAVLVQAHRQFGERARQRRGEQAYTQSFTHSQRYVLRELRQIHGSTEDPAVQGRVEPLEHAYRQPLPQAVNRELNRLRRDAVSGEPLLRELTGIYHAHGLRDRRPHGADESSGEDLPLLVCSEAFVKTQPEGRKPAAEVPTNPPSEV
jgi:superfamily II DNA or RNA helicase